MSALPDILPASKPVGTALSIVRQDNDMTLAACPYDYSHLEQHKAQDDDEACGGYQTLQSKAEDASTQNSCVASLRSTTCGSFVSAETEVRSPLATHAAVSGLQAHGREHRQDSGVYELTSILNRLFIVTHLSPSYLTLRYLRGGLTPSAETSSVGPVRNPEVPEGCHNLLEALANLKREDHRS